MIIDIKDVKHIHSEIQKDKELIVNRFKKGKGNLLKAYNEKFINEQVHKVPLENPLRKNNWNLYFQLPRQKRLEKINMVAILKTEQDRGRTAHSYYILLDFGIDLYPYIFSKHFVKRLHERIGFDTDNEELALLNYYLKQEFSIYSKWHVGEYEYRCINKWGFVKVNIFPEGAAYFWTIVTKEMLWEKERQWAEPLLAKVISEANEEDLEKLLTHWGEFVDKWELKFATMRIGLEKIQMGLEEMIQNLEKNKEKELKETIHKKLTGK